MAHWLFKSEPNAWSWDDHLARGEAGEPWDGIRNYQARNNMRTMVVGDLGFFYHSIDEKRVVGVVEVTATVAQDPKTDDPRWECVTIKALGTFPTPVTLAECKADLRLSGMVLVNNTRLSVQPVSPEEWRIICDLGGYSGPGA
ncbi:MAG: putative RNA-binding protein with PUA-like domain [Paracoccaceae bacterium]|jgi:predicted RNA-binding protein with PUA-like domain